MKKQLYGIMIEADPSNSLGGSCIRDLYNISNHISNLDKDKYSIQHHYILTNQTLSNDNRNKFLHPNIDFQLITSFIPQINNILENIPKNSCLILYISGHGYQMIDKSGDEIDNMDEYIRVNNGIIIDDQIKLEIIDKIDNTIQVIAICDTCHSGSMFDLDYQWCSRTNKWILDTKRQLLDKNIISIGACKDNQLENCDIGNIGYGGALTVHLIDNNLVELLLDYDNFPNNLYLVNNKLSLILHPFNQTPILQTSNIKLI